MITEGLLEKVQSNDEINVTFVYPENPKDTYWGFSKALKFINKKATMPPLGLITIAGLLPENYNPSLIDMNVEPLTDKKISNSDIIMLSGMAIQMESIREVVDKALAQQKTIFFGGPYATKYFDTEKGNLDDVTNDIVWVLNEGENTLPLVIEDLNNGILKNLYARVSNNESLEKILNRFNVQNIDAEIQKFSEVVKSPPVKYDLLKMKYYDAMIIQFSRGCPGGCEFCDVSTLFGRRTRGRPVEDIEKDLVTLYEEGWRGNLFVADDNTIGSPVFANRVFDMLIDFQGKHKSPFNLNTEMSLNIKDNLLEKYVEAGGKTAFLGIETPNPKSLVETGKKFNLSGETNPDNKIKEIVNKVKKIQEHIEVTGGFIIGFDSDDERIFDLQERLIRESGIPIAMVGLLSAVPGTPLYERMEKEGRIINNFYGNNTHGCETNFITKIDPEVLKRKYNDLLQRLYSSDLSSYFDRALTMFKHQRGKLNTNVRNLKLRDVGTFIKSSKLFFKSSGLNYFKFLSKTITKYPFKFPDAVRLAILGYYFADITNKTNLYK